MIQVVLHDRRSPRRHEHHGTILRHGNVWRAWLPCKHRLKELSRRMHSSRMRTTRCLPYGEVSLTETPPDRDSLDRDKSGRDPPSLDRYPLDPLDRDPVWTETPRQRPPGQRPPGQRPSCRQTNTCENNTFAHFVCGRKRCVSEVILY